MHRNAHSCCPLQKLWANAPSLIAQNAGDGACAFFQWPTPALSSDLRITRKIKALCRRHKKGLPFRCPENLIIKRICRLFQADEASIAKGAGGADNSTEIARIADPVADDKTLRLPYLRGCKADLHPNAPLRLKATQLAPSAFCTEMVGDLWRTIQQGLVRCEDLHNVELWPKFTDLIETKNDQVATLCTLFF